MTGIGLGINIGRRCCSKAFAGGKPTYPKWFNDTIVCWYDIKKQGATNELLKQDPTLIDHSGHNLHLTLIGFEFNENSGINKNGDALTFNRNNCYGISTGQPILTDYTIIAKRIGKDYTYGTVASKSISDPTKDGAFVFETWEHRANYSFGGLSYFDNWDEMISYQTKTSYNGIPLTVGTATDTDTLYIGSTRTVTDTWSGDLYAFLLFNKSLELWQIEWIRKNILGDMDYYTFDSHKAVLYDSGKKVFV